MSLKHQLISLFIILIINIVSLFPATGLILLAENGDQACLIIFGIANALFLRFRLKINIYTSFILGFLNVALSIYLSYVIKYFHNLSSVGMFLLYLLTTLAVSWSCIKTKWEKFNLKKFNLILLIPVLILSWSSYQIKKYYRPKTEKINLTTVEFQVLDSTKNFSQNDSIEVRIKRNPLFGLRETYRIGINPLDKNGKCTFNLSKNHDYQVNVEFSDGSYSFEEITSTDLKVKNKFTIKK